MPLGPTGRRVKNDFLDRYGASKGKAVFYGKENSDPKFAAAMKSRKPTSRSVGRKR